MQQMVTCPRCGQPNQAGQRLCWHCGSILATGCPNCGAPLDPGSRFCGSCGAQMPATQQPGWGQSPPQQSGWGQPPPQQPGWGQPPPQQPGWGQPPPQQPGWGQQPPPQQPGWGQQPPPQQPGWGQQPPPQPGWNPPGGMPSSSYAGDWGQAMPRKSGGGGLVLLLVVLLIALGAFSYFAFISDNPPWGKTTTPGTTSVTPITTGPFVFVKSTDASANKAVMEMRWETSAAYKGQVEYGKTETYGSTTTLESDLTKTHVAALPNLDMSSTYHYRIVLKDKDNEVWRSEDSRFNTPAPATQ